MDTFVDYEGRRHEGRRYEGQYFFEFDVGLVPSKAVDQGLEIELSKKLHTIIYLPYYEGIH